MTEAIITPAFDTDAEVSRRYAEAARSPEPALCCPSTGYDPALLKAIPDEVLAVDYGCGDPTRHAREGDVALDLGSGSGKACFMLAQRVGPKGRVIGVDGNREMLALARKHAPEVARRIGFENVRFHQGRIQDLRLDLEDLDPWLRVKPVTSVDGWALLEAECSRLRTSQPMVADESVDLVVSNCVLNLVRPADKKALFAEIHRVLRRGGRAVISDIVCDEDPTPEILADPELWSGCISGAFREDLFLEELESAGLYGVEILERAERPWRVIDGIEFRALTVRAYKGKEGPCLERNQAVVYHGPWKSVVDDDGHRYARGQRMAVCDKTYHLLTDPRGPYAGSILSLPPRVEVPLESAAPFACDGPRLRDPRVTKEGQSSGAELGDGTACTSPDCC